MIDALPSRLTATALACLFIAAPALADDRAALADDRAALVDFFAGQGCAIGPASRAAAMAAGFSADQIDALAAEEAGRDGAVSTGGWLVMAPTACRMRPPEIGGTVQLGDPEVVAMISAPDAYADQDSPGCFVDAGMMGRLQHTRGMDADTAFEEYIRLIGRSIISGEMTFYSDSMLVTPFGFQSMTGICAQVPAAADIRRDHDFLIQNFDPLVRAIMTTNSCDDFMGWVNSDGSPVPDTAPGTATSNAWMWYEVLTIAIAAGWFEGISSTEKGMPRPPLCHYQDMSPPAAQLVPSDDRALKRKAHRNSGGP